MNNEKKNSLELIESIAAFFKENTPELHKYKFPDSGSYKIGMISVVRGTNTYYLNTGEFADGEYLKRWKNDVGGIVLTDIKKNRLDEYYEFDLGETGKVGLLRRVPDEDDEEFIKYGLPYIKQGDFKYVFIRFRNINESYVSNDGHIDYTPINDDVDDSCYTHTEYSDNGDIKSFELF